MSADGPHDAPTPGLPEGEEEVQTPAVHPGSVSAASLEDEPPVSSDTATATLPEAASEARQPIAPWAWPWQARPAPSEAIVNIRERLRLSNTELIESLLEAARSIFEDEEKRRTAIEGKAASLLAGTGFSITVASGVGVNAVLSHQSPLRALGGGALVGTAIIFLLAMAFGVLSSMTALVALRVRSDIKAVDPADVFSAAVLEAADVPYVHEGSDDEKAQVKGLEASRTAIWRRAIIEHLHYAAESNHHTNERKASSLGWAQTFFLGFLMAFAALAVMIVWAAVGTAPKSDDALGRNGTAGSPGALGTASMLPSPPPAQVLIVPAVPSTSSNSVAVAIPSAPPATSGSAAGAARNAGSVTSQPVRTPPQPVVKHGPVVR